jgi:hypothetical protein
MALEQMRSKVLPGAALGLCIIINHEGAFVPIMVDHFHIKLRNPKAY